MQKQAIALHMGTLAAFIDAVYEPTALHRDIYMFSMAKFDGDYINQYVVFTGIHCDLGIPVRYTVKIGTVLRHFYQDEKPELEKRAEMGASRVETGLKAIDYRLRREGMLDDVGALIVGQFPPEFLTDKPAQNG